MGINKGIIASRHRLIDRYRELFSVNQDFVVSNVVTGEADIIIKFDSIINGNSGFYGINRVGSTTTGFLLRIFPNLTATFLIFGGAVTSFAPITASPNWRNFRFEINTGGNNKIDFYIDNVLHDSINIGSINTSNNSFSVSSLQHDVIVDNLGINEFEFELNEKTGFVCDSTDNTKTLTGTTSNAGGLTYWEANVIKERN